MKLGKWIFAAACLASCGSLFAQSTAERIGQCLSDNTSGRDRKDLAMWIFAGIAQHPEAGKLVQLPTEAISKIEKQAGAIYNRLFNQDCKNEIEAATKIDDTKAVHTGFEVLGRMAMTELMSDPNTGAYFSRIEKYVSK